MYIYTSHINNNYQSPLDVVHNFHQEGITAIYQSYSHMTYIIVGRVGARVHTRKKYSAWPPLRKKRKNEQTDSVCYILHVCQLINQMGIYCKVNLRLILKKLYLKN